MTRVAGADGARIGSRSGWVVAELVDGDLDGLRFVETLEAALEATGELEILAADVPIGHEDPQGETNGGRRQADEAARDRLGERSSSVFPIPPLDLLEADDQQAASSQARSRDVIAPSAQVWNLREKILEANRLVRDRPLLREAHPELSFHVMSVQHGSIPTKLEHKRSWNGLVQRQRLLEDVGLGIEGPLEEVGRARPDDLLDAVAVAWTAHRVAMGKAMTFPADPPSDPDTGNPVAIHA